MNFQKYAPVVFELYKFEVIQKLLERLFSF